MRSRRAARAPAPPTRLRPPRGRWTRATAWGTAAYPKIPLGQAAILRLSGGLPAVIEFYLVRLNSPEGVSRQAGDLLSPQGEGDAEALAIGHVVEPAARARRVREGKGYGLAEPIPLADALREATAAEQPPDREAAHEEHELGPQ